MVIFDCADATPLPTSTLTTTSHTTLRIRMIVVLLWRQLGCRRIFPREGEDAPAKQAVPGEPEEPERDERDEDVVDQHEHPPIPEHLAQALVGGDQLGRDDGGE